MIRIAQIMGKMENGGVEAVVMNYYRNIDRNKIQFDFIVDNDSSCPQEYEILSLGGKIYRIAPYQDIIKNMNDLKSIFKKNKYKIVHSHLTTMSMFSLKVAKDCNIPVRICHGHNTACKGETKKNILKYMLRPFAKLYATHYFACSEYAGKWLFGKKVFEDKKITIINNAVDYDKYKFDLQVRNKLREELGIEDKFVIGHIGRFVYQKNHDFLIEIFNEVHKIQKNAVLILIGEGELLDNIKEKVNNLVLNESVIFMGVHEDAYKFYQAFDTFVLPSRYEGLPVVAVEAQINGLPCLFSDKMTKETLFSPSAKFLKCEHNIDEWVNEIIATKTVDNRFCVENPLFNIHTQSEALLKIYENLGGLK